MQDLKPRIHENGMDYVLVGDYYVPDLKLPEEHRPLGKWGRMHREYLRITNLGLLNEMIWCWRENSGLILQTLTNRQRTGCT